MTSESDEAIQIYKIREGRHDKQLLSKKYGVKLAKFTRNSSSIIYASTKQNGTTKMSFLFMVPSRRTTVAHTLIHRRNSISDNTRQRVHPILRRP